MIFRIISYLRVSNYSNTLSMCLWRTDPQYDYRCGLDITPYVACIQLKIWHEHDSKYGLDMTRDVAFSMTPSLSYDSIWISYDSI